MLPTLAQVTQLTQAMLWEWRADVSVVRSPDHADLSVTAELPLGLTDPLTLRLMVRPASPADLQDFVEVSGARGRRAVFIALGGLTEDSVSVRGLTIMDLEAWRGLLAQSGFVSFTDGMPLLDRPSLRHVKAGSDARLSLVSGLLWLNALARNRVPPSLRWTRLEAHELFERCFFQVMISTFRGSGESWGTRKRGRPIPDGVLTLPGLPYPLLYDCKARADGYVLSMSDLRGFADYIRDPLEGAWSPTAGVTPGFLVVSGEIGGGRARGWSDRQSDLRARHPGARLVYLRTSDLVDFALTVERAGVSPRDRDEIDWELVIGAGDVRQEAFQSAYDMLTRKGYEVDS